MGSLDTTSLWGRQLLERLSAELDAELEGGGWGPSSVTVRTSHPQHLPSGVSGPKF